MPVGGLYAASSKFRQLLDHGEIGMGQTIEMPSMFFLGRCSNLSLDSHGVWGPLGKKAPELIVAAGLSREARVGIFEIFTEKRGLSSRSLYCPVSSSFDGDLTWSSRLGLLPERDPLLPILG